MTMIHPKRLAQLVRKWQRVKVASRDDEVCCTTSPVADKGHCVIYTADGRRFEVPLEYLGTTVFGELLRMSQQEFGFTCDGRITLPLRCSSDGVCNVLAQKKCIGGSREGVPELCSDALPISKPYCDTCSTTAAACSL